jgi:inorganic phosphate transporter, PiT family
LIWFYLTSGLFLGWSLGANDAANIFGTAVSTKMVKFKTAAIISCIFLTLGAVISGAGTSNTINELGEVNAIAGAFTISFSAAFTVFLIIRNGLPVSVSQAIIGAIIGWNLFTSTPVDIVSTSRIVLAWIINPVFSCLFSYLIFKFLKFRLSKTKRHILEIEFFTKFALIAVLIFGAYSMGANNISKVVGVFINSNPFQDIAIWGPFSFSGSRQLFLIGALAMCAGIITYSKNTIYTVGQEIFKLNPLSALASVSSASIVLFMFSSESLEKLMHTAGLPGFPLVPVSLTQSMVGAILGISLAKGVSNLNFKMLGKIGIGWIVTPIASALFCLIALFFVQNVFQAKVVFPISYEITNEVIGEIKSSGITTDSLNSYVDKVYNNQADFRSNLTKIGINDEDNLFKIFSIAKIEYYRIDSNLAKNKLNPNIFDDSEIENVKVLHGKTYSHNWQIVNTLSSINPGKWKYLEKSNANRYVNSEIKKRYDIIFDTFKLKDQN